MLVHQRVSTVKKMSKARMRLASRWLPYLSSSFCGWELGQTISNTISNFISIYRKAHCPHSILRILLRCETLRALAETPPCAEAPKKRCTEAQLVDSDPMSLLHPVSVVVSIYDAICVYEILWASLIFPMLLIAVSFQGGSACCPP